MAVCIRSSGSSMDTAQPHGMWGLQRTLSLQVQQLGQGGWLLVGGLCEGVLCPQGAGAHEHPPLMTYPLDHYFLLQVKSANVDGM